MLVLADLDIYVIDWGLGEDPKTSQEGRSRRHLHGVRAFMADDKLRLTAEKPSTKWLPQKEHDLQALCYTFAAVYLDKHAEAPWGDEGYVGVAASERLIKARRACMAQLSLDLVPEALRSTISALTSTSP
jgi:hypothetical protein